MVAGAVLSRKTSSLQHSKPAVVLFCISTLLCCSLAVAVTSPERTGGASSFDISAASATHRRLLHVGPHRPWWRFNQCPRCTIYNCSPSDIFDIGHCWSWNGRRRRVRHCFRWKEVSPLLPGPDADRNSTAGAAPLDAVFAIPEGDTTVIVRGVTCFSNEDCALPVAGFASINGTAPLSSGGSLTAECARSTPGSDGMPPDDGVGVCMCLYGSAPETGTTSSNNVTSSETASAVSRETAARPRGVASRSLLQRSSTASSSAAAQGTVASAGFFDVCVQRPVSDSGMISDNSLGVVVPGASDSSSLNLTAASGSGNETDEAQTISGVIVLSDEFFAFTYESSSYEAYEYDDEDPRGSL